MHGSLNAIRLRTTHASANLLTVVLVLSGSAGCDRPSVDSGRVAQLMTSSTPQDTLTMELASKQRRLHALLASRDTAAAKLISERFTFVDAASPESQARDPIGHVVFGQDYFRALNRDYPPEFATISEIQVMPEYNGAVMVIVTHPELPPTFTSWERHSGAWRAVRLTINSTDEAVAKTTEWYLAASARSAAR